MDMPFLVNLSRAVTDYVVLDLETTGLDPAQDRIVQLVAIRYRAGQPNAALNLYVNPAPSCHPIDRAGQDRADGPSRTAGPHRAGRPA
ncbi:MAG: hypothetical protein IT305_32280 [Chloroflexi bacterium]|nr:hypothetical protein [Chloroflexota bacterium]